MGFISDLIKALTVQFASVLPAATFVLINAYIFVPIFLPGLDLSTLVALTLVAWFVLMVNYFLVSINTSLIRLFQGSFLPLPFQQWLLRRQHNELQRLYIDVLRNRKEPEEFDRMFPYTLNTLRPTRLGNVIAAFEDYPRTRYGIDSTVMWSRLQALLGKNQYRSLVESDKAVFDFLLNTSLVIVLLGLEIVVIKLYTGDVSLALVLFSATVALLWGFYKILIPAAIQWGNTIRVAFDLYRFDLFQQLGVRSETNDSFQGEFARWQSVADFIRAAPWEIKDIRFLLSLYEIHHGTEARGQKSPSADTDITPIDD